MLRGSQDGEGLARSILVQSWMAAYTLRVMEFVFGDHPSTTCQIERLRTGSSNSSCHSRANPSEPSQMLIGRLVPPMLLGTSYECSIASRGSLTWHALGQRPLLLLLLPWQ